MSGMRLTKVGRPLLALALLGGCESGPGPSEYTPAGPSEYTLSLTPAALTIVQGTNGSTTVTLTRTHFTDPVTLSLDNALTGVSGLFSPQAPTGSSATLTVSVGATVAPGQYDLTLTGATGADMASATLALTVAAAGTRANVVVDFSNCWDGLPLWLAYQDGTGPWVPVTGVGGIYQFDITSGRGGYAYTMGHEVVVDYRAQAEFAAGPVTYCAPPTMSGAVIFGAVAGLNSSEAAVISVGGNSAVATFGAPQFQVVVQSPGVAVVEDLVAYRYSQAGTKNPSGIIIRRDQVLYPGFIGSVGTLDFAQEFSPGKATITVGGVLGGEVTTGRVEYQVGAACRTASLGDFAPIAGTSFTAYGVPADRQRPGDYHLIRVGTGTGTGATGFRSVAESFHLLKPRIVALPAPLAAPTITVLGGRYQRPEARYTLPADYQSSTSFRYWDPAGWLMVLTATFGYLGGPAVTLALPDFTGLPGWDDGWVPSPASSSTWSVSAVGGTTNAGSLCRENARFTGATMSGSF